MSLFKGTLKKVSWKEAREDVIKVNPEFATIIDELDPNNNHWLAKVSYPYGSMVMKRALLMLPNKEGNIVPLDDPSIDSTIRDGLSYNLKSNPVSIVLKNSFELFLPLKERIILLSDLVKPGTAFGAWRILNPGRSENPQFIWDMTAGGRAVFMLPKITEVKKHMQLKKTYNLDMGVPNNLIQHWEIFRQLANSSIQENPWTADILYFSESWFTHLKDPSWRDFYQSFYTSSWTNAEFWRNSTFWDLVLSLILKDYEARPNADIIDTTKFLLYMGVGAQPGMAPVQDTLTGPFDLIQKIYMEDYELKNYPPIIMHTSSFNLFDKKSEPVYYSLQFPTNQEFKPSSRKRVSLITDLHEIRSLILRYEQQLLSDKYNINETSFYELFKSAKYDYFHNSVELHPGMRNTAEMIKDDKRLITTLDKIEHKNFPDTSTFLKGCIRVSKKH